MTRRAYPRLKNHIAAIDLGSNSFHMIVARQDYEELRPLERLGEKVKLAAGLGPKQLLDDAAMARGWACLKRFADYIEGMAPESVRVVATDALRRAKNREQFTKRAEAILGVPVEVIAGREEARLIYLGVAHTCSDDAASRLVVDIGGGSTEFIIGERFEPRLLESLHMGCVSYSRRFFPEGEFTGKSFRAAYYSARRELLPIQQAYRDYGWTDAVGSSGTVKAVQLVLDALAMGEAGITVEGMRELKRRVLRAGSVDALDLPGLKEDRRPTFAAGLAILMAVFDALKVKTMQFSTGALREGLLYDLVGRAQHEDVRERTVNAMMQRYHVDAFHARRVERDCMRLFDMAAFSWGLDDQEDAQLLRWAVRLHEIGLDISHVQFHKHGAYLLTHSDMLGFSRQQQSELADLVRSHRRAYTKAQFRIPEAERDERLLRLCILLRLAIVFNHARKDLHWPNYLLQVGHRHLKLQLGELWLKAHPLTEADLKAEALAMAKIGYRLELC